MVFLTCLMIWFKFSCDAGKAFASKKLSKKKIRSAEDLRNIVNEVLNSNQKTVLLAIYNNQNQRRYIGIKLD